MESLTRNGAVNMKHGAANWKDLVGAGYNTNPNPNSAREVNQFRSQWASPNRLTIPVTTTSDWNKNWNQYDAEFRQNYNQNFNNSGYTYDEFVPVYQYGYFLATSPLYSGDWNTFEQRARANCEARNPNTS